MFTGEGFSLISGFRKLLCSQEMDSVLIQVSWKFDVHQRNLYWNCKGRGPLVNSHKCRLMCWLSLAPRPHMHFFTKPFLALATRPLTVPSFRALTVLFPDCQKLTCVKQQNVALILRVSVLGLESGCTVKYSLIIYPSSRHNTDTNLHTAVSVLQFGSVKCIHLTLLNWNSLTGIFLGNVIKKKRVAGVTWCHSSIMPTDITLTVYILEKYLI